MNILNIKMFLCYLIMCNRVHNMKAKTFQKNKNKLSRKLFAHPRSEGKSIHLVWSITLSVDDLMVKHFTKNKLKFVKIIEPTGLLD